MKFSVQQIAELLKGNVEGDPQTSVSDFGKIEDAKEGQLSFLANPKYEEFLYTTQASAVIVNQSLQLKQKVKPCLIRVPDAYSAFATLLQFYEKLQLQSYKGIHKRAVIGNKTSIAKSAYIGPNTIIEDGVSIGENSIVMGNCCVGKFSKIGDNCLIYSGVNIYKNSQIGNAVILHSGVVIGSDGFGFAPQSDGSYLKIPQIGNVVIEDNVEIGANTCVDRATMGSTIIRQGVKLDNLIQVAHNVEIGQNTVIASQAGIAGSTKIGKQVRMGGQVGISGHLEIGDGVSLGPQTGVLSNIAAKENVMGSPHMNANQYYRSVINFRNFNALVQRIDDIEQKNKKNS